jgi:release factor glutamine methyltransferase
VPGVLDLGTGTGCLAITLATQMDGLCLCAVDISGAAIELARENARRHGVLERIDFRLGDMFGAVPVGSKFALIVSNPPYIATKEIEALSPEVRDWDPRVALDGGDDGLGFYRRIATEGPGWLLPGGRLLLEFGDDQVNDVEGLLGSHKWIVEKVVSDYSGRPRVLQARLGEG